MQNETEVKKNLARDEKSTNPYYGIGDTNLYYMNTINFGTFGGICTCPDGTSYRVADNNNDCLSLNCDGGTQSQCHPIDEPRWMHMGVICNGKTSQNNILTNKPEAYDRTDYNIGADTKVKIQWNGRIVCIDEVNTSTT